ncbi:tRNA modification GTPase MnmE [Frankliniella fusca]|uniref:tRNA modification GTPase MnmE n=1 Tax=Frankliniella fusca TaxID=407009 RepID=A0AAE1H9D0_9NEOP|nr:tRNA modification GTPase MnmE [Frankliniella fusca]KAK3928086.1 tRNA modification GTPase MnmE [Frankliniella fusca]
MNTPGKVRKRAKLNRTLDLFTKGAIRGIIYEFHRKSKHVILHYVVYTSDHC